MNIRNIPLHRAVTLIHESPRLPLNIVVNWKALADAGIKRTAPVNLALTDVSVKKMLEMILESVSGKAKLTYTIDKEGVITISTQAAGAATEPVRSRASRGSTTDQVIVEDLALAMLVAVRDKDNAALKAMSVDRIKGWRDAWPHFSRELRERFTQMTGKPFTMYPTSSIVIGDVAAVKCTRPKELKGGVYLALFFVKTNSGWKNFSIRNSPPSVRLETHLRKAAKAIGVQLPATQPATRPAARPAAVTNSAG